MATFHIRNDADGWTVFDHRSGLCAAVGAVAFTGMSLFEAQQVARLLNALERDQKFAPKRHRRHLRRQARVRMRPPCGSHTRRDVRMHAGPDALSSAPLVTAGSERHIAQSL